MKSRIDSASEFLVPIPGEDAGVFPPPSPSAPKGTCVRPGPSPIRGVTHHNAQMPFCDLDHPRPFHQAISFNFKRRPVGGAAKNNIMCPKLNVALVDER